ncbi:MAG: hypothetical protein ACK5V3_09715 [Bdellovibrionales bacterium]
MNSFTAILIILFLFLNTESHVLDLCSPTLFEDKTLKSGCLWEKSQSLSEIKTLHFTATSQHSDYFIHYNKNQIRVFNHRGKLRLNLRDGRELLLPAGFEVWISELNRDKKNEMGMITPIDLKVHMSRLQYVWEGDLKDFKKHIKSFAGLWGPQQDMASRYYKGLVTRKIATIEDEKMQKRRKVQREQEVRKRNQELLYDRTFSR